jgi:hypothetical protein
LPLSILHSLLLFGLFSSSSSSALIPPKRPHPSRPIPARSPGHRRLPSPSLFLSHLPQVNGRRQSLSGKRSVTARGSTPPQYLRTGCAARLLYRHEDNTQTHRTGSFFEGGIGSGNHEGERGSSWFGSARFPAPNGIAFVAHDGRRPGEGRKKEVDNASSRVRTITAIDGIG